MVQRAALRICWAMLLHAAVATTKGTFMRGSLAPAGIFVNSMTNAAKSSKKKEERNATRTPDMRQTIMPNVAFVGCGCFWHVQHEIVHFEEKTLDRHGKKITAFTGYAGGLKEGKNHRVCYHNPSGVDDYAQLGHAEVVSIGLSDVEAAAKIAKLFFGHICPGGWGMGRGAWRAGQTEVGSEYRAIAGFPGGIDSPEGKAFAQEGRDQGVNVVAGQGNDPDVLGTVYVMDSTWFPFHQAELFQQFHDDMNVHYSSRYHHLREELIKSGAIHHTGCPGDT